tara:strand:+ start:278 stop:475 length:198 start_codon:yes stop_codon:yes gene_type:complete
MHKYQKPIRVFEVKKFTMNTDQLTVINLAAILVGTTYTSNQKVLKWGGVIIAVASAACAIFRCGG